MMTCEKFDRALADYVDGKAKWPTRIAMRLHRITCRKCRRYLQEYVRTVELVKSSFDDAAAAAEPVPPELVEAVKTKIRNRGS